jgi:para-nitrobenzyl esterase
MDAIKEIEKDTSISPEAKQKIISEVLNGRWFSGELDEYYGNKSLWLGN